MEEKRTGGVKEFIYSAVWAVILVLIGRAIVVMLPEYKVIGVIITLLMFCVLGFYVLTRYSAVFTYTLKNNRFRVNRKIGHRNKETELSLSSVKSVSRKRQTMSVRAQYMRVGVFSKKDVWYIQYRKDKEDKLLVCTISHAMAEKIRNGVKHAK